MITPEIDQLLKKTEKIGNNPKNQLYQVNDYIVRIYTKIGRQLISCSCQNHSRFCNENPLCKHKKTAIIWEYLKSKNQLAKSAKK